MQKPHTPSFKESPISVNIKLAYRNKISKEFLEAFKLLYKKSRK